MILVFGGAYNGKNDFVKEKFNIDLQPEVRFLGGNNEDEVEICKILFQK